MFDPFGRKRIEELKRQVDSANWNAELSHSNHEVVSKQRDDLIRTLRDMDQLIFMMSQCTSWESMRPHFNKLQSGTETRMRIESDRIRDVLIPEIRAAYTDPRATKQIEAK